MSLPPEFSMGHSEFNEFLWASTGIDENGAPLSVLSVLARRGLDPWQEAARLTRLPVELAVAALADQISPPEAGTANPDRLAVAGRLVALLRRRGATAPAPGPIAERPLTRRMAVVLLVIALAGMIATQVLRDAPPGSDGSRPSPGIFTPGS